VAFRIAWQIQHQTLSHLAERRADPRKMLGQMFEVEQLQNRIDDRRYAIAFLYCAAPVIGLALARRVVY
jgi:hypothetical protein